MNVLLGSHGFPPQQAAGAELRTYRTARWLIEHGHAAQVIAIDRVEASAAGGRVLAADEQVEGVPVRRLSYGLDQRAGTPAEYDNPFAASAFDDLIAAVPGRRFDVFHLISGYRLTGRAILAARARQVPVVVTLTDFWFLCPRIVLRRSTGELCRVPEDPLDCALCLLNEKRRYRGLYRLSGGRSNALLKALWRSTRFAGFAGAARLNGAMLARRAFQAGALAQAQRLIAPSAFLAELFKAQGVPAERLAVLRQGVNLPPGPPAAGAPPARQGPLTFGYVGQIAEHKGLDLLVRAFRRLPGSPAEIRLAIHGDPAQAWPPFWRSLQPQIAADPRIVLAGPFAAAEARRVYAACDVLVVPSIWYENSPNVILEAFACGLPVMTADLGGMAELVTHDRNGYLFPPGDEAALAQALQHVGEHPEVLARWRAAIPPMKTVDQEMAELVAVYEQAARA